MTVQHAITLSRVSRQTRTTRCASCIYWRSRVIRLDEALYTLRENKRNIIEEKRQKHWDGKSLLHLVWRTKRKKRVEKNIYIREEDEGYVGWSRWRGPPASSCRSVVFCLSLSLFLFHSHNMFCYFFFLVYFKNFSKHFSLFLFPLSTRYSILFCFYIALAAWVSRSPPFRS